MKNKKRKSLFALIALVILSGVSAVTGTYAYWNNLQKVEDETILVGIGLDTIVDAKVSAQAGKQLVPAGRTVDAAVEVEQVIFTYDVKLSKAVSVALDLTVVASEVKIGGETTNANLVNIWISAPDKLGGVALQEVVVTVTITEPATEEIYNAIKNQDITFKLTFTVSQL